MTARPIPPRRRTGLRWLVLGLLALPLLELVVLVLVGQQIGFWWTLALVVGLGLVGAWLGRRESGRTYRALQETLRSGRAPADEVTDAILVLIGALLLVLPGFVSDALGLVAVLPLTRPVARRIFQLLVVRQAGRVTAGVVGGPGWAGASSWGAPGGASSWGSPGRSSRRGDVVEGEVVEETPPPGGSTAPGGPRLEE